MRYLGGKSRIAKKVAEQIHKHARSHKYFEPFVGGAWILKEVRKERRVASDSQECLIRMYTALQKGWVPPDSVTREEYYQIKAQNDPENPLTAFCGFGCSFAGKFWGGYAACKKNSNYAQRTKKRLLLNLPLIQNVLFLHQDYFKVPYIYNYTIYCDPPYAGTTGYKNTQFDHKQFWDRMRQWSKDNVVLISEYSAPEDFETVAEFPTRMCMDTGSKEKTRVIRIEKLFRYAG